MANEIASLDVGHAAGADPLALVFRGEPVAGGGNGETTGRTQAGRDGCQLAVGCDLDHPTAPRGGSLGGAAKGDVKGHAQIAVGGQDGAERVLVIAAGDG